MISTYTPTVGDHVVVRDVYARPSDHGQVYIVRRTLQVNIEVEPVGGGRLLRAKPEVFEKAPDHAAAAAETVPYRRHLHPGEVVTVDPPIKGFDDDHLFVVLADRDNGVKLTLLGGDGGRYWNRVPRARVHEHDHEGDWRA